MCAIYGEINAFDKHWCAEQQKKALERGTDLTSYQHKNIRFFHTRLATNKSKDVYPIVIDGAQFAMNGIVSEKNYKNLKKKYKDKVSGYSVDSAYLLKQLLDTNLDFKTIDTNDYVAAFWLVRDDYIYVGNKDYPLYIQFFLDESLVPRVKFSSFAFEGAVPCGNAVIKFDKHGTCVGRVYEFKNLIYKTGK